MKTISIAPPNSLILIMDSVSDLIPEEMGDKLVAATETCIAVGCRSEHDGVTEVHMGLSSEVTPPDPLRFDGEIIAPTKKLTIFSVFNEEMVSTAVSAERIGVKIFANDPIEPSRIYILFDG